MKRKGIKMAKFHARHRDKGEKGGKRSTGANRGHAGMHTRSVKHGGMAPRALEKGGGKTPRKASNAKMQSAYGGGKGRAPRRAPGGSKGVGSSGQQEMGRRPADRTGNLGAYSAGHDATMGRAAETRGLREAPLERSSATSAMDKKRKAARDKRLQNAQL